MPTTVQNLLNTSVGIEDLLSMPETSGLPQTRAMASAQAPESTLDSLYGPVNARSSYEALLQPDAGDGRLLTPQYFQSALKSLADKLAARDDEASRTLLKEELEPLLTNTALLNAYRNLMLGG